MSLVIFDNTQIITFDFKQHGIRELLQRSQLLNLNIKVNSDVSEKKSAYLEKYLSQNVIEWVNAEFLGSFEEWKDRNNIPNEIVMLGDILKNLHNHPEIKNLKLILIRSASKNREEDVVLFKEIIIEDIYNALFYMSIWCTDSNPDILILRFKEA